MRIAFLHYRFKPNPDYVDLAQKLRERGNQVWFGERNDAGDLAWHDGDRVVAVLPGLKPVSKNLRRIPVLSPILKRLNYLSYIRRIRSFLRRSNVDVIQIAA